MAAARQRPGDAAIRGDRWARESILGVHALASHHRLQRPTRSGSGRAVGRRLGARASDRGSHPRPETPRGQRTGAVGPALYELEPVGGLATAPCSQGVMLALPPGIRRKRTCGVAEFPDGRPLFWRGPLSEPPPGGRGVCPGRRRAQKRREEV